MKNFFRILDTALVVMVTVGMLINTFGGSFPMENLIAAIVTRLLVKTYDLRSQ